MKMTSIFNVTNEFEFVATVLVGLIGHDCGCETCRQTRTQALSALMWLMEHHGRVNMQRSKLPGGINEVHLSLPVSRKVAIPDEVLDVVKSHVASQDLTEAQRAAFNGFLAGAEHGSE